MCGSSMNHARVALLFVVLGVMAGIAGCAGNTGGYVTGDVPPGTMQDDPLPALADASAAGLDAGLATPDASNTTDASANSDAAADAGGDGAVSDDADAIDDDASIDDLDAGTIDDDAAVDAPDAGDPGVDSGRTHCWDGGRRQHGRCH